MRKDNNLDRKKEIILLLADCQLHLNRAKARDEWKKVENISELEKVRDLLLATKNEPTIRFEALRPALAEVMELLNQMIQD